MIRNSKSALASVLVVILFGGEAIMAAPIPPVEDVGTLVQREIILDMRSDGT